MNREQFEQVIGTSVVKTKDVYDALIPFCEMLPKGTDGPSNFAGLLRQAIALRLDTERYNGQR
jgi:hypothetical protein